MTDPLLLSIPETAARLGRSTRTVWRLIETGDLPAVVEHGALRVRTDELAGYVADLPRPRDPRRPATRRRRSSSRARDYRFLEE